MMASLLAHVLTFGLPLLALALLAAACAAFLYVPLVGKQLAVGLIALAAATFAYDLGFRERASLDKSAQLAAQITQLNDQIAESDRQAKAAEEIANAAGTRQTAAELQVAAMQQRISAYETDLAKSGAPACSLTDSDVGRLLTIGGAKPVDPAEPPGRPAGLGTDPGSSAN